MNELNIGKTIITKRREKGITQEELAKYIGITKASVSKWETNQSYPDITLLPQLATYFGISVDELIDYKPQLTKEGIKDLFQSLSLEFAKEDFETVYNKCKAIIKEYYSCYELLLQIAILYLNHHNLTENAELKKQMLDDAFELCSRVSTESKNPKLSKNAQDVKSIICIYNNEPQKALEILGEDITPLSQEYETIASAYQMLGNNDEASKIFQISIYQHLITVIGTSVLMINSQISNKEKCEETLNRIIKVADAYNLDTLHENAMLNVYMMASTFYNLQKDEEKVLFYLEKFANTAKHLFPLKLHGDDYFDKIEGWIDTFALGTSAPTNEIVVKENIINSIEKNPAFSNLLSNKQFNLILNNLKKEINYGH